MKKRLRILVHQPRLSYYIGGGETVPLMQAKILSQLGHHIEISTSKPPRFSSVFLNFLKTNPEIKIHYIALKKEDWDLYKKEAGNSRARWDKESILFGKEAQKFYSNTRIYWDLIITHLLSDNLLIPDKFIKILHLHGIPLRKRKIDKIFLSKVNGFVAVSKSVKKGWEKLYPELKKKNIKVCYNGIESQNFPDLNKKRDIDLLFVGRLIKIKGIDTILKALRILDKKRIYFNKFVLIGRGPQIQKIKKQIKKLNLSNKVELKNTVCQKDLIDFYNRANIFLCPSHAKEGVLTTMLEAASCGCAIITTNCCGMPEFIKDRRNGLLIDPKNHIELAEKIELLLKNKKLREAMAKNAQKEQRNHWDSFKLTKKLEKIYLRYSNDSY